VIYEYDTRFQRFPLSNFKYFLTLFSKFFSSFPHGTCSLSVSRQYLALDETYHLFRAAIPNNSTLWACIVRDVYHIKTFNKENFHTGFSPSMMPSSNGLMLRTYADNMSNRLQFHMTSWIKKIRDFHIELYCRFTRRY